MRVCPQCSAENEDYARFCARCGTPFEPPADPLIGHVVAERYRIVSKIGEGGMGRVYLAEQRMGTTTRHVAIKVLTTSMSDQLAVARFYRECETVVKLSHPNTIRFYDFGTVDVPLAGGTIDRKLYIAMEYVAGRSLAHAIEQGPLALAVVDRLVRQIAGALTEAHRRGIVHRDLKPENVLLAHNEAEGEIPKVCDFGIAKDDQPGAVEITAQGTIIGTPAYMSPEQITGLPVDERSDVYALALMTYEMLAGARPFSARTPLEWATAHMTEAPRPFDEFPATRDLPFARRAAILRALEKDPLGRTPTVRAFVEDFTGEARDTSTPPAMRPPGDAGAARDVTPEAFARTVSHTRTSALVPALAGLAVLALFGAAAIGVVSTMMGTSSGAGAGDAGPTDAAIDAAPVSQPRWLAILHDEENAQDATRALGTPDGQCGRIGRQGTIALELTPGVRIATDGTPAADLEIVIVGDTTAPYRVDVGVERHEYTTIAQGLVTSTPLDVDQFGIDRFRYVRIKNRATRGTATVCIDAVAAHRAE
jgi:serine/threonine-protein kinase